MKIERSEAPNRSTAMEAHYTRHWGGPAEVCPFHAGPVHELPPEFRVLAFPPRAGRGLWTYATCGMSLAEDARAVELHILSPVRSELLVELLYVTAHFHRTGTRLDLGHTVEIGRPWLEGSRCSFLYVSLPYLDGPALENFRWEGEEAALYWLIPITWEEREFKKAVGAEALEARFEESGFHYANPGRPSVV